MRTSGGVSGASTARLLFGAARLYSFLTLLHPRPGSAEAGGLPRPVDVGEPQRHVRRTVDAVPAGEVLLPALLRDPVWRQRQERELLVDRAGTLAVARAAGRGEHDLCPGAERAREHVHR